MSINLDVRNIVPAPPPQTAQGEAAPNQPLSWKAAWLALRETLRPFPDAFQSAAGLVQRLLDECDRYGDPGGKNPENVTP